MTASFEQVTRAQLAGEGPARRFWARMAQALLVAWAVDAVIALLFGMHQDALLHRYGDGEVSDLAGLRQAGNRADAVMRISIWLTLLTAVAFVTWMFLESRRLEIQERPKRYRAGWTVGAWFVPVAGLLLPYEVMRDLWSAAFAHEDEFCISAGCTARRSPHRLVTAWWCCLVSVAVLSTGACVYPIVGVGILPVVIAVDPLSVDAAHMTASEMAFTNSGLIARNAVLLAAAVLAFVIVQRLAFRANDE